MRAASTLSSALCLCLLAAPQAGAAEGLQATAIAVSSWRARLAVGQSLEVSRAPAASLLGDYFVDARAPEGGWIPSGLRASSGLVWGPGTAALGAAAVASTAVGTPMPRAVTALARGYNTPEAAFPVPYVGLGYSAANGAAGWGLNADVGLAAPPPTTALAFGRAMLGGHRLDSDVRNLRWRPVLQLGLYWRY